MNKTLNTWYDFGYSKGGSIIDLVCVMVNDNVSQALKRLSLDYGAYTHLKYQPPVKQKPKNSDTLILDKVCEISEPKLIDLLNELCISIDIAKQYLKQVYCSFK